MLTFPEPPDDPNAVVGTAHEGVSTPALAWNHLPEHRRLFVAWTETAKRGEFRQGDRPCEIGKRGRHFYPVAPVAVLGSDGLYHLVEDEDGVQNFCNGRHRTASVTLLTDVRSPETVPVAARCASLTHYWPLPPGRSGVGLVRRILVELFGPTCGACHQALAVHIDHDPISGHVRGYLCRDCNQRLERCLHRSNCGFADYLNDPPAFPLSIRYPHGPTPRERERLVLARRAILATAELTPLFDRLPAYAPVRTVGTTGPS